MYFPLVDSTQPKMPPDRRTPLLLVWLVLAGPLSQAQAQAQALHQQLFHRVHNVSHSQILSSLVISQPATSVLQCAASCLVADTCNAFELSGGMCSQLNLTYLEERRMTDSSWPELTMVTSSLAVAGNLICHGGEVGGEGGGEAVQVRTAVWSHGELQSVLDGD